MVTAARMGIPLIDGDYSGRAVPEDMQTSYFLKGIKPYPAAIVDWWGNIIILKEAVSSQMVERIIYAGPLPRPPNSPMPLSSTCSRQPCCPA